MGNYRKMALLGLPVAQQYSEQLSNLERELAALVQEISDQAQDAETALQWLSGLSADLANIVARTCFRMSATKAYAELCLDRMRGMAMRPVRGFTSLDDFTERRLLPAMRTCEAFSSRLENLFERASATSALLRTRVDTALAQRNQELLASMNRRTELQLHLQRTVESLSVIAITYYALGVWEKAKPGLAAISGLGGGPLFDLLLVPAVFLAALFLMRRLTRSAHHKAVANRTPSYLPDALSDQTHIGKARQAGQGAVPRLLKPRKTPCATSIPHARVSGDRHPDRMRDQTGRQGFDRYAPPLMTQALSTNSIEAT